MDEVSKIQHYHSQRYNSCQSVENIFSLVAESKMLENDLQVRIIFSDVSLLLLLCEALRYEALALPPRATSSRAENQGLQFSRRFSDAILTYIYIQKNNYVSKY